MHTNVEGEPAAKTDAASTATVSSKSDAGMSDADVKCYENRFTDLSGKAGREHFLEIGTDEGRLPTCAVNLTSTMTQRYLNTNPDLQHSIGRGGPAANALARIEYTDTGYLNKDRGIEVPSWDATWQCGDGVS